MKLTTLLSRVAPLGVAAFLLALALDANPLALFALAASILILLIGATDYAPGRYAGAEIPAALRRSEAMPLAA